MALLFYSDSDDPEHWRRELAARVPDLELRAWPDTGDPADIEFALVWKPRPGLLASLPNLRLILSLGMGVDHIFDDPELPRSVPVARLVDPDMVRQMSEYALTYALAHHRRTADYWTAQIEHAWRRLPLPDTPATRVGVLGVGAIGADVARKFAALGFATAGWSRTPKDIDGVESFHGPDALIPFLERSDILVCVLPRTPETVDVLDAKALAALPAGALVINIARGEHVVEEDLLAALDSGHLAGAVLDVFRTEPLPEDHRFWDHPRVLVTPHIAGLTNPKTSADQVAANIERVRAGEAPHNIVDPERGY